jgi:hypothetical protein
VPSRVVAFTVSGQREKYLRQALDSWARVRGLEDWTLAFSLEPCDTVFPVDAFYAWLEATFPHVHLLKNPRQLNVTANTRRAMDLAFTELGASFAVCAEEDVTVSSDVLEYFSWAASEYAVQEQLAVVCAHARLSDSQDLAAVTRAGWFSPLVWGTWADTWTKTIRPGWGGYDRNAQAWDTNLRVNLQAAGLECLFPARSRSLHFGEFSTQNGADIARYMYELSRSECFEPDPGRQEYREVAFDDLPPLVV